MQLKDRVIQFLLEQSRWLKVKMMTKLDIDFYKNIGAMAMVRKCVKD